MHKLINIGSYPCERYLSAQSRTLPPQHVSTQVVFAVPSCCSQPEHTVAVGSTAPPSAVDSQHSQAEAAGQVGTPKKGTTFTPAPCTYLHTSAPGNAHATRALQTRQYFAGLLPQERLKTI